MVVAEILTGIALVKQSVDFIKSNIDTVKDIGEIGDTIENLFVGEEQCQKARAKNNETYYAFRWVFEHDDQKNSYGFEVSEYLPPTACKANNSVGML